MRPMTTRRFAMVWVLLATMVPALAASPAAIGAVGLTFYYPVGVSGPLATVMNGMVDDFNRIHPGVQVTPVFAGDYTQSMTKTQTAVMGGSPPDVAVLLSTDLFTLLDMNAIVPLDRFIQASGGDRFRQDFYDAFWLNSRIGEVTYSIPFQRSTIVLYYNQDAFQKAGLDPAQPPKTWTELAQDAQRLTVRDAGGSVTQWGVGIPSSGFTYWLFQGFVAQSGQDRMASADGTRVYFDTPQAHQALDFWMRLQAMKVEPQGITSWDTLPQQFVAGQFAMIYHSIGSLTFVRSNARFKVGTAFMPAGKRYGTPTGGGNFYIFSGIPQERQQAAWEFVQWMTAPQQTARWSQASGYVAVRKSAIGVDLYRDYLRQVPQALTASQQLQYAQAELSTHQGGRVQALLSNELQGALTGAKSPDAALRDASDAASQILAPFVKK
jgi:sn-glycerol 3-phosphate transport system substrate-binding protein